MSLPRKILAIQFKSLGDCLLLIPSLEALREHFPDCELHALVSDAAAPLLHHHPCLTRVWSLRRVRGKARLRDNWPIISALRAERFDRSVDFAGNDRGAILSFLCGAASRLGPASPGGFFGRRLCYNQRIIPAPRDRHETLRSLHILSAWNIPSRSAVKLSLHTDPALQSASTRVLPRNAILCHSGAGISKKEWPATHWAELHRLATDAGWNLVFSSGMLPREQNMVKDLKALLPDVKFLPPLKLPEFLAVLKQARGVISNDTGPMHFAGALGVPVIALFGPTSVVRWAPLGEKICILQAGGCTCPRTDHDCEKTAPCMAGIPPEIVFRNLTEIM